jgi:hypothetical protein
MAADRLAQPVVAVGRPGPGATRPPCAWRRPAPGTATGSGPRGTGPRAPGPSSDRWSRPWQRPPGRSGCGAGRRGPCPDVGGPGLLAGIAVDETVEQAQGGLGLPPFARPSARSSTLPGHRGRSRVWRPGLDPDPGSGRCPGQPVRPHPAGTVPGPGHRRPGRPGSRARTARDGAGNPGSCPFGPGPGRPRPRAARYTAPGPGRAGEPVGGQAQGFGGIARSGRAQHRQIQRVARPRKSVRAWAARGARMGRALSGWPAR